MPDEDKRLSSEEMLEQARERYGISDEEPAHRHDDDAITAVERVSSDEYTRPSEGSSEGGAERPGGVEYGGATSPTPTQPGPPAKAGRRRGALIGGIVVAVILFGGTVIGFFTDARRDSGGEVVEAGQVGSGELQVGDCLLFPEGTGVDDEFHFESLEAVPCSDPHDMEVFGQFIHPAESFPGDESLSSFGEDRCLAEFEVYTGVAFEDEARLIASTFTPDSEAWSAGERQVECVLMNYDGGPMEGSMRDRGLIGYFGLEVGQCYDSAMDGGYWGYEEVSCDQGHEFEYYWVEELEEEAYPGEEWMLDRADEVCWTEYESYVGQSYESTTSPDYTWLHPTVETWSGGDRLIQCFLVDPEGGSLTGSYSSEA